MATGRTTDDRDTDAARHREIMELLRTINERVAGIEEWVNLRTPPTPPLSREDIEDIWSGRL